MKKTSSSASVRLELCEADRENSSPGTNYYRQIIEHAPTAVFIADAGNRYTYVNRAACRFLGYEENELLEKKINDIIRPTENERLAKFQREQLESGEVSGEWEFLRKDGTWVWGAVHAKILPDGSWSAFVSDISERKRVESQLEEMEDRFRLMADSAPVLIWISGADKLLTYFNKYWLDFTGRTLEQELGEGWMVSVHPDDFDRCFEIYSTSFDARRRFEMECRLRRFDGEYRWLLSKGEPLFTPDGEFKGYIGSCIDVTERRQADEQLRDSQKFISRVVEVVPNVVYIFDLETQKNIFINRNIEETLGYTTEDSTVPGINFVKSVMHPDDFARFVENEKKFASLGEEETAEFEYRMRHRNGRWRWFLSRDAVFKRDADGKPVQIIGTATDITGRKSAEEALQQSEERYRVFIENSSEGIWRLEMKNPIPTSLPVEEQIKLLYENSYIAECNDAKARQYGFDIAQDLVGKRLDELFVRSDVLNDGYLKRFINSGYRLIDDETHEKDKNDDDVYFLSNLIGAVENGTLTRVWGTQRDITAIKQARQTYLESEEQLRRSQKVEALGRLAGGVAHDFNNFLAVIMLHVDMLNLQLPVDSSLRFRLEEIKSVTNNAAGMVRQLLAFGRKQTLQPHPVVLNHVARDFINILRPLIGEDIEIQLNLDANLGVCFVDPDQVTQVLMNLAVNARDAMPKGGVLKISTSNVVLDKNRIRLKTQPVGDYVQLTVSDTGIGMTSETRKRIFEPFFTTKEPNKGTGLGLATVYGIIKQSNGFIWVETESGKGTTFEVQFPRIDQPATTIIKEETAKMPGGSETILLVEDEDPVRRAAVEVLNILGYEVFEAANGEEAIKIARKINKPIHLLLTDLIMPRMNGRELSEKIKSLHSESEILFMSGYNDDIISDHGILDENVNFINKPFTPLMLASRIREILEKK